MRFPSANVIFWTGFQARLLLYVLNQLSSQYGIRHTLFPRPPPTLYLVVDGEVFASRTSDLLFTLALLVYLSFKMWSEKISQMTSIRQAVLKCAHQRYQGIIHSAICCLGVQPSASSCGQVIVMTDILVTRSPRLTVHYSIAQPLLREPARLAGRIDLSVGYVVQFDGVT
jgi:hypothetical protein